MSGPRASLLLAFQGTLLVNSGSSTAELHARPLPEKEARWRRYQMVTQAIQQLYRLLTNGKQQYTRGRRVASAGQGVSAVCAGTHEPAEAHSVRRRCTARELQLTSHASKQHLLFDLLADPGGVKWFGYTARFENNSCALCNTTQARTHGYRHQKVCVRVRNFPGKIERNGSIWLSQKETDGWRVHGRKNSFSFRQHPYIVNKFFF